MRMADINKSYTRNVQVGIEHYRMLREEERTKQKKPGWFGGVANRRRGSVEEAGYRTVGDTPVRKHHTNIRDDTMVALQLEAMPTYYPWFTYTITGIQLLIMLALLAYAYTTEDMAAFKLVAKSTGCEKVASVNCPLDFNGNVDLKYEVVEEVNWTYGPNTEFLLKMGAKWSACMRFSTDAELEASQTRGLYTANNSLTAQCIVGTSNEPPGYPCTNVDANAVLDNGEPIHGGTACCTSYSGTNFGMMTFDECQAHYNAALYDAISVSALPNGGVYDNSTGAVTTQEKILEYMIFAFPLRVVLEEKFPPDQDKAPLWQEGEECDDSNIVLRPCCGIRMNTENFCELLTQSQCLARYGTWNTEHILCSDVMCFADTCRIFSKIEGVMEKLVTMKPDKESRNVPDGPFQWWRFITAIFIHSGAVHATLVLMVQMYAGKEIESQAGFLRTLLIYFISGIGGNVISGIFAPTTVSMGADPAVYGLIGVMLVELFQAWQVVPNVWWTLTKLVVLIAISLLIGTLPYVDNWSHIGGFAFGIVSGIVFLPYITFGKWDARRKKILLYVCIPLLFIMFLMAFVVFYLIGNTRWCESCHYFNCIVWSAKYIDCDSQF
jgi:membrane associated rhomboid family serine protease